MPVWDFRRLPRQVASAGSLPETQPIGFPTPSPSDQRPTHELHDDSNAAVNVDVKTTILPAFEAQDRGIRDYFSGITLTTKDGVRSTPLAVRMAGGDKSVLAWKQDLKNGRIRLPVMSIQRTGWQFNPEKWPPPYVPVSQVFLGRGDRVRRAFRARPLLIDYTLSLWTERKQEAAEILTNVEIRFNPLATYFIDDGTITGTVVLRFNGTTDNSDVDSEADRLAKVRYDVSVTAEGWMTIPHELVTPTVLGRVTTLNEQSGRFLDVLSDPSPGVRTAMDLPSEE